MSSNIRLIARLDIKGPNLIKGVHLEGLRKIGDPNHFAKLYYDQGVDEIIYMDIVASLYGRNNLQDIIKSTVKDVYVPITVGGGIKSVTDVREILRCGAEKVAINTAIVREPMLIKDISRKFGSQCMVASIEAKKVSDFKWEVYIENGREKTGIDVIEWAQKICDYNAGEILLTSIDKEGTGDGFDHELISAVSQIVPIPVIASGGMQDSSDGIKAVKESYADAIAMADILHYKKSDLPSIRSDFLKNNINVRVFE